MDKKGKKKPRMIKIAKIENLVTITEGKSDFRKD